MIFRDASKATLDDERGTIAKNNDVVASVNELLLKLELQNGIHNRDGMIF